MSEKKEQTFEDAVRDLEKIVSHFKNIMICLVTYLVR